MFVNNYWTRNNTKLTGRRADGFDGLTALTISDKRLAISERGFTFLELLIALAVTALIGVAIYGVFRGGLSGWQRGRAITQISQNARVALDRMSKEIRCARSFSTTGSNDLKFIAAINVPASGTSEYDLCEIEYYRSATDSCAAVDATGTFLCRRVDTNLDDIWDAQDVLAQHVAGLTFTYPSGRIRIAITIQPDVTVPGVNPATLQKTLTTEVHIPGS